jgi:hypothetical protein
VADRGDDVVLGCLTMRTLVIVLSLVVSCVTVRAQGADGFALFMRNWTVAETGSEGLGPLFNEASCSACHWVGGGARIRLRAGGEVSAAGLLVRLTDEAGRPDPHYGVQVQNKAVAGMAPEGIISLQALKTGDALTRFVITLRRRQAAQLSAGHVPSVRMAPRLMRWRRLAQSARQAFLHGQIRTMPMVMAFRGVRTCCAGPAAGDRGPVQLEGHRSICPLADRNGLQV